MQIIQRTLVCVLLSISGLSAAAASTQTVTPKTIIVHIGQTQKFVSTGATKWTVTEGTITLGGLYSAPAVMPTSSTVKVTAIGPGGTGTATISLVTGAFQTVTPKTLSVALSAKEQFVSSGATAWTAVYGTITSTGIYTAPAVFPEYGTDTISVSGTHGSTTAVVTVILPTPTVTRVGTGGQIPLGLFSLTVSGTGFTSGSIAWLHKTPLTTTWLANNEIRIEGFSDAVGPSTVMVSNKTLDSNLFPVTIGVAKPKVSAAAARRFLEQAAFGPTPSDAENLQIIGLNSWLNQQYAMTWVSNYNGVKPAMGGMPQHFLTNAVMEPDQLRQRVAFALSQIFVTSLDEIGYNASMITYQNMFLNDAFTNYSTIMQDVSLSSAMGQYLNMANNAKANTTTGAVANENYARELMQLFTIGTNMLNQDGSIQYDSNHDPIPTYSQFTVTEFARVYTGWAYHPAPGTATQWGSSPTSYGPMVQYPAEHDTGSKQLLSGYVSPAGTTPLADLQHALYNIFHHSNVGPFVGRQLIQHLVKSNPSPAYISRVAAVFNNNGAGVRGDMKAVITAILLDPEARANDEGEEQLATDGHLQEPALFIAAMVRAFGGQMTDENYYSWDLSNLGQNLFSPPSVFNYYAPTSGVPGTALTGGEFQLDSPNNAILRANEVSNLFSQWSSPIQTYGPGTTVDLSGFIALATQPLNLVNALDLTLTHGNMPTDMKVPIVAAVTAETGGNLRRVQRAAYLILTSSYYNVWH